jgi:hypothetical protein
MSQDWAAPPPPASPTSETEFLVYEYPSPPEASTTVTIVTESAEPTKTSKPKKSKANKPPKSTDRTSGQKRGNGESSVTELRKLCGKLRKLEPEKLQSLCKYVPLKEVATGTVLEVLGCESAQSVHGEMAILECIVDETRVVKKIMAPTRFLDETMYPCVMVYFGKGQQKTKKGGVQSVHLLRRYGGLGDTFTNHEEMHQQVTAMRNMLYEELERLFVIRSLKEFTPDTVLLYTSPRTVQFHVKEAGRDAVAWVVSFETTIEDKAISGEVYIPTRYADRLQEQSQGVIVYRGIMKSKSTGHDYYAMEVLSAEEAAGAVTTP